MVKISDDGLYAELKFYLANQDEMVENYDGKVIVIKDHQVIGEYDSESNAYIETQKTHELGTFLIQRVSEGDGDYTVTIYSSRVMSFT